MRYAHLINSILSQTPRIRRLGAYTFWYSLGLMLPMGIDRLVICPVLNRQLGEELFGGFLWVVGLMNLFGNIGANGFSIPLMRDMAAADDVKSGEMFRGALLLTMVATYVILPLTAIGSYMIADPVVRSHALELYCPLGAFAFYRSIQLILLTNLRIHRRFITLFMLKLCECLVLLIILVMTNNKDLRWIGVIYTLSILCTLPVGYFGCKSWFGRGRWITNEIARWLIAGWASGALITLLDQTQVYASRIILGALGGSSQVATLYAGTSIGNMFVLPIGLLGNLIMSLLAGQTSFIFLGRRGKIYLAFITAVSLAATVISYFVGTPVIRLLYPDMAEDVSGFYHWIAIANGCTAVMTLVRPVALKYAKMSRVTALSGTTLALQLGALALMVPFAGARGAAISLALSSGLGAVLWILHIQKLRTQIAVETNDTRIEGDREER